MAIPLFDAVARETVYAQGVPVWYNSQNSTDLGKHLWPSEKWKWAYGEVESEAQRTATTELEIVESYWKFTVFPNLRRSNDSTRTACPITIILSSSRITVSFNLIYSLSRYLGNCFQEGILRLPEFPHFIFPETGQPGPGQYQMRSVYTWQWNTLEWKSDCSGAL